MGRLRPVTTTSGLRPTPRAAARPASRAPRPGTLVAVAGVWVVTRVVMALMLVHGFHGSDIVRVEVSVTYHNW